MRREDKQVNDISAIEEILSRSTVCRIGLCENNQPYVVPLCFGYKSNALYFHCAREGTKLDIIRRNSKVCFEVDIDHELVKADKACDWTMKYKSVIGFGKAMFVEDAESKRKGLDIIMKHYSDGTFLYPDEVLRKTTIIKIEIETMTGKKLG